MDFVPDAPVSSRNEPPALWWRLYQDPVLDGLVRDALAQNRDLAVAAAHVEHARAIVDRADAARLPVTNASVGAEYGKQYPDQIVAAARGDDAPTRWGYAPSFALSWEIDLWGRVRHLVEAAHADAQAVQAASDAMRVVVAAETTQAYIQACSYNAQIATLGHSISIAERIAALTTRKHQLGEASALDTTRTLALADSIRARLPELQGKHQAALFELAALTGRTPGDIPEAATQCNAPPALAQPIPVGDGVALLRRRPDLREAERKLAAADAQVGVAVADLYPSITLGGSVNWLSTSGNPSSLGNRYAVTWGIGPLISWNFPNLAANRAHLAQAHADANAAEAAFEGLILQALKETEQALAIYNAAWQRRAGLEKTHQEYAHALQLAELSHKAGAADALDVLDAEQHLISVETDLAESTQQVALDQVAAFKALGGGWQQ